MTEHKSPVDQALDLFVYAPLGLALDARVLLPKLVERGRNQVTMARMIGQFAVAQGQGEAGRQLTKLEAQLASTLEGLGLVPPPARRPRPAPGRPPSTASPAPRRSDRPGPGPAGDHTGPGADGPADGDGSAVVVDDEAEQFAAPTVVTPAAAGPVGGLAIPDYDSLAASQVIPRLAGLTVDELAAVGAYEAAKRGRKTILNRVAQLQSA